MGRPAARTVTRFSGSRAGPREVLKAQAARADIVGSTTAVKSMGDVIQVKFGEVQYSANVQGVLSKRIQAKLDQLYPERWNRADRIAAQAISDMKRFDQRISFTLDVERPVGPDGAFSERAFAATLEKLKTDLDALLLELRKAAHLSIASTAYSTVINVTAPDDMLVGDPQGSR